MPRQNRRRNKRVKNLIVISTLSAVLLSISTYAWFIGMRTVNVSAFDVEIAAIDGLALSLNGVDWSENVGINKENYAEVNEMNNTNSWGGEGLIPMSSVGELDPEVSRMKLFEKGSLTATPGGYRILVSRVENMGEEERDGYVAFDLFVKNQTGSHYIPEHNLLDEEAIYLTVDSEVNVAEGGIKNTGIENSVRVAFTQIGRVKADVTDQEIITGITCDGDESEGVTGICRDAQIWEPNNTSHVQGAINWYNKSCRARTGEDLREKESYGGDCGVVVDGQHYPTYAINQIINSEDRVDIYDGKAFNSYMDTVVTEDNAEGFLTDYKYFTDTEKYEAGTARLPFMYLAPNSITKVRIYVYIEGQDIDNYDFAQIGKKITVNFGFTKQRFTEADIDYNDPLVNQQFGPEGEDLTPPRLTLLPYGDTEQTDLVVLTKGDEYEEAGATAVDLQKDGTEEEIEDVKAVGVVNTNVPGTYYVTYKAKDKAGNLGTIVRTIVVEKE